MVWKPCAGARLCSRGLTQLGQTIRMMALALVKSHLMSSRTVLLGVVAVTFGLVIVDVATWKELNIASIYGLPLLLAGSMRSRLLLWSMVAWLTIVTFVVYSLQIPAGAFTLHEPFFVNRVLDVVGLLLIAWLLHLWMNSMEASETHARRIETQNEKLKAVKVSRQMVTVQESERRMLANQLHDLVGQKLAALSINLNIIESRLSPDQATQIGTRLDDSLEMVEETIECIRDVITELRPTVLDDHGLIAALRWYAEQFAKRTDVATSVIVQGPAHRLPPVAEEALFRIAQEALVNVAKYAGTRKAVVTLESTPRSICLTIADDGCGFVPTPEHPPDGQHGWGLMIMRERAETVGAQLGIESAPGLGTRVSVTWRE